MIHGIGVDLVTISRIEEIIETTPGFLRKVFTESEIAYCQRHSHPYPQFAARFAAKEALVKALGEGFGSIGFHDVSVEHDDKGKPRFHFSEKFLRAYDGYMFHLSLSHERTHAIAIVVAETHV